MYLTPRCSLKTVRYMKPLAYKFPMNIAALSSLHGADNQNTYFIFITLSIYTRIKPIFFYPNCINIIHNISISRVLPGAGLICYVI